MKPILPVLQVNPSDLASCALVVGDPRRAETAAALLENPRQVGANRAYVTYTGHYAGQRITVCSHGVGAAGASVCFTELLQGGVQVFIRAGTCGALQPDIEDGALIIGLAAVREDGTSEQLVPLAYPAYADPHLILALQTAARSRKVTWREGVIVTQAHLYPGLLPSTIGLWQQAKVAAVEMEYAALLVIASLNGACAGGIFVTDGNLARQSASLSPENYQPIRPVVENGIQVMLRVALEALTLQSSLSGAIP